MIADTAIMGPIENKGADLVPHPSLEQVGQFIRASKPRVT